MRERNRRGQSAVGSRPRRVTGWRRGQPTEDDENAELGVVGQGVAPRRRCSRRPSSVCRRFHGALHGKRLFVWRPGRVAWREVGGGSTDEDRLVLVLRRLCRSHDDHLVNEAALGAARAGKQAVDMADFDEAIDRVIAGLERKSRVISPREKEIVAYHETGHALVAEFQLRTDRVAKISIIPRGVAALAYTQQQPTEDRYLMTRAELLDRLDVLVGGRVAEEIIFGDITTGAQDDLQRATDIARHMIATG